MSTAATFIWPEAKLATIDEAAIIIEGNEPGRIHLTSREDLREFMLLRANTVASLSVCLTYLVNTTGGPDSGFVRDFAEHLNHLIFQQEIATKLMLSAEQEVSHV